MGELRRTLQLALTTVIPLVVAPFLHAADSSLYVKVQLENSLKTSALKPGDVVAGKLATAVYSREREVFPAGSTIRLTVDKLERQRRPANDHWPWMVQLFTPRYEKYPEFRTASVTLPGGAEVSLHTSVIFFNREVEVRAPEKKALNEAPAPLSANDGPPPKRSGPMLVLEARLDADPQDVGVPVASAAGPANLASGTQAKVVLLGALSAGRSRAGDAFQARLIEPVRQGSQVVLPEGSLLTGEVTRSKPPRWLSRSGSLALRFTGLSVPGGMAGPVTASLTGAHLERASRTRMDAEGGLRGDRPGKAWMVINLGVTAGLGKVVDDGSQLLIEALVSTATDVSTAGTARVVSTCVSGIFLLTRHGRDVILPKYTELEIVFDRPVR